MVAQDVTTITANSDDISDNLDLEAVASIFGESKDLEDFEKRLNDPKTQISNLDLNNDGEVDYLRIMETAEKNAHSISIQAVIGKDQYQEVAVIDVEKDSLCFTYCQIPIVYKVDNAEGIKVIYNEGRPSEVNGLSLDVDTSKKIFKRTGDINQIIVSFPK